MAAVWRPRLTAIPHWWVTASFASSSLVVEGGDQVAAILALFLIPVALSDPRRWHWGAPPALEGTALKVGSLVACSCLTVIRLQVAVIYFFACTAKFAVREWANGTALYYWLVHPTFGLSQPLRPVFLPILANPWGVTLLTWGVLVMEALLFTGFLMEHRYRPLLLKAALAFHFGIVIFHGLFTFFLAMAGALILYLRPVDRPFRLMVPWPVRAVRREPAPGAPALTAVPQAEVS